MATDLYETYSDYPQTYQAVKRGLEKGDSIFDLVDKYIKPKDIYLESALLLFMGWCIREIEYPAEDIVAVNVMATWLMVITYKKNHEKSISPSIRLALAVADIDGILSLDHECTPHDLMTAAIKHVLVLIEKDFNK